MEWIPYHWTVLPVHGFEGGTLEYMKDWYSETRYCRSRMAMAINTVY